MSAHPFRTVLKISCVFQLKHHSIQEHMKHSITKALNESFEVLKLILLILFFVCFFQLLQNLEKNNNLASNENAITLRYSLSIKAIFLELFLSFSLICILFFFAELYIFKKLSKCNTEALLYLYVEFLN